MRNSTVGIVGAICLAFGVGGLAGMKASEEVRPTEMSAARSLAGFNAQLIGFDCDDHRTVVLATEEDEFPEKGCREIRRLDDEEDFL